MSITKEQVLTHAKKNLLLRSLTDKALVDISLGRLADEAALNEMLWNAMEPFSQWRHLLCAYDELKKEQESRSDIAYLKEHFGSIYQAMRD